MRRPLRIVERVQQDRIVVEKFADYWNKDNIHIDRIVYLPIVDATVRLASLKSGGLELLERLLATDIKEVRANSSSSSPRHSNSAIKAWTSISPTARKRKARSAPTPKSGKPQLCHRPRSADAGRVQWRIRARQPVGQSGASVFPEEFPGHQARRRQSQGADQGSRCHDAVDVDFLVPKGAETQAVAEVIQAMAAEVGINMKIRVTEFATSLKQGETGEFQAYLLAWSGRTDPDGNLFIFHKCKAPQNNAGYCNADADKLLDQGAQPPILPSARRSTKSSPDHSRRQSETLSLPSPRADRAHGAARGLYANARRSCARGRIEAEVIGHPIPAGAPGKDADVSRQATAAADPDIVLLSVIIFSLQQLLPGDPALIMAGEERDPEVIEQIRKKYRLDQPIPVQYVYWVKGVLTGDLASRCASMCRCAI